MITQRRVLRQSRDRNSVELSKDNICTLGTDMTADTQHLPSITLTDPHNQNGVPSPAQSPVKENGGFAEGLSGKLNGGRPSTPGKHGR